MNEANLRVNTFATSTAVIDCNLMDAKLILNALAKIVWFRKIAAFRKMAGIDPLYRCKILLKCVKVPTKYPTEKNEIVAKALLLQPSS